MRRSLSVVAAALCAVPAAQAQVVNGDFQAGGLAPWTVVPTATGRTISSTVAPFDMDGSGPLPPSPAARVIVGQTLADTGFQGVSIEQPVSLTAGRTYRLRARWAVHAWVNAYNKSAGRFELLVDGQFVDQATAPTSAPGLQATGLLGGFYTAPASGSATVSVRVVRDAPSGEEVFQYVDDVTMTPMCPGDFDQDGATNVADIFAFLSAWFAATPASDFNRDGTTGEVADIFAFLSAWFAECA